MFGFGAAKSKEKYSIPDTVERLCDRINTSSALEDRRDAVRGLKGLSRRYRVEVGAQGLAVLASTLAKDQSDTEIMVLALDTLYNVMCDKPDDAGDEEFGDDCDNESPRHLKPSDLGVQFTEMFLKQTDVIPSILSVMDDYDFTARWASIKLLSLLVENAQVRMQTLVLSNPTAVSRIIDLLADPREVIRNQAIILLTFITQNSSAIQKIVAFECGFEKILHIIEAEGFSEGLIVVEDCIHLMSSLLYHNVSNLTFFVEGGFTSYITKFFNFTCNEDTQWSSQKISNVFYMLRVIKELTSPDNPQQTVVAFQKMLFKHGVLNKVSVIVVSPAIPIKVLSEAIVCLGNIIANNRSNQNFFENVMTFSTPPKPALLSLLMLMTNEKQPLSLRCSVLYFFHSYLTGNEDKQTDVINTLLPSKVDVSNVTSGQLLCGGLFSKDAASNWLCSVALSYTLKDHQKEQLLRVQLATSIGNPPVTLMQQTVSVLTNPDSSVQSKIGIMLLLCTWLNSCPQAVTAFLKIPSSMSFFISQLSDNSVSTDDVNSAQGLAAFLLGICFLFNENNKELCQFDKKSIRHIVEKRIGLETFKRQCSSLSLFENFSKNSRKCHIDVDSISQLVFDFQFVALFKQLENQLMVSISGDDTAENGINHTEEVNNYKEMIRQQDEKIKLQESRIEELTKNLQYFQNESESLKYQLYQMSNDLINLQNSGTKPEIANTEQKLVSDPLQDDMIRSQEMKIIDLSQQLQCYQSEAESLKYQLSQVPEQVRVGPTSGPEQSYPNNDSRSFHASNAGDIYSNPIYCALLEEKNRVSRELEQITESYTHANVTKDTLQSQIDSLTNQLSSYTDDSERLKWYETQYVILQQQYEQLYQQMYEIQMQFNQQFDPEAKIQTLQSQLFDLQATSANLFQENEYLRMQIETKMAENNDATTENYSLKADIVQLNQKVDHLSCELNNSCNVSEKHEKESSISDVSLLTNGVNHANDRGTIEEIESVKKERDGLMAELNTLKTDQEDLMVLLADQDSKINEYKARLRRSGAVLSDDSDSEGTSGSENY